MTSLWWHIHFINPRNPLVKKHRAGTRFAYISQFRAPRRGTSQSKYGVTPNTLAGQGGPPARLRNAYENRCVSFDEQIAERTVFPWGTLSIPVKPTLKSIQLFLEFLLRNLARSQGCPLSGTSHSEQRIERESELSNKNDFKTF